MDEAFDITGRVDILRQALMSDKNRVAFLLGAGCPLSILDRENKPLIPDIVGLTCSICGKLEQRKITKIKNVIIDAESKEPTIEDILSRIRLLIVAIGNSNFDGLSKTELTDMDKEICQAITEIVNKELPISTTPYHELAAWISGIPRENPIEIFTTNYDLLIEQVLEEKNIPFFDGFVGSKNAFFDLHSIEHEDLPSRWVRLWKIHGSINWWTNDDGSVLRTGSTHDSQKRQMIYPSHLKYSQSRKMPYLAMQDKLSKFLSTEQPVLITNGYSFVDQHLNELIVQRLSANPRSVCFGLLYGKIDEYPEAVACAKKITNLHLLAKDAGLSAGEQRIWINKPSNQYDYLTERSETHIECKIGDFAVFSKFLLRQVKS